MAALLGIPAIASVNEAGVQLPCDDRLWDAPDAASWWAAMQEVQASGVNHDLPFLSVFRGIFAGQSEMIGTSDFGRSIVSHSMYRYVIGMIELTEGFRWTPRLYGTL
jgi:hypothetical protein